MTSARSLAALLLPLLLACTVGPDYEAPDREAPARFVSQEVLAELNAGHEQAAVAANWWEGFDDPLLNRLVEEALENNLRIGAAVARLREARARRESIDAADRPQIDAGAGASVEEERIEEGAGPMQDIETTTEREFGLLSLFWSLDVFGRNRRAVEAAQATVQAAEARLHGLVLDVSGQVAREYLGLRGNQRQLALLEESVALQERTLSIVQSRFDAGLSPELDVRRAETSVERLRAGIPPLEEDLLNARNRLATLTGRFPGAYEEELKAEDEIPVYAGRFAEVVPLEVLERRPDLHEAEARLKQRVAEIGVAKADFYPAFDVAAEISLTRTVVGNADPVEILLSSVSAAVAQFLYDGGARGANLDAAEAAAEAALLDYRQALLRAAEEVETALAAIAASRERQVSLEKAVQSSTASFNQAEYLYQEGLISFLDVVDAQRVLADAEQALAAERTDYATFVATLFRVLGSETAAFNVEDIESTPKIPGES